MKVTPIYSRYSGPFALLVMSALFFAGCSSDRHNISPEEAVAPKMPAFLAGPAGLLLTNSDGYSARVTIDRSDATNKLPTLSGHLLAQGSHLLYVPAKGDKSFIWDAREHNGYITSEILQGYAPVSSLNQIISVLTTSETAGSASEKVNGLAGHEAEISVALNDGSTARFKVWRAADFDGLPVRIKTLTASAPFELNLSEVRHESLPPAFFLPPDGFAKYDSPELMNTELLVRKSKLRKPDFNNNSSDEPSLPQHRNL